MNELTPEAREFFKDHGKKGGKLLSKKVKGTDYYKEIGKKGAAKRWGKNLSTKQGG